MPPTTPILDTFTRANEDPLSGGGNWANLGSNYPAQLKIASNQCLGNNGTSQGGSYWTPQQFVDFEIYVTNQSVPTLGVPYVCGRIQQPGGSFTWDGYVGAIQPGLNPNIGIYRVTNAGFTVLAQKLALDWVSGDGLLLRGAGSLLTLERRTGGVWTTALSVSDSTYTSGYLGLVGNDTCAMVNFGGGPYVGLGAGATIPIAGGAASW